MVPLIFSQINKLSLYKLFIFLCICFWEGFGNNYRNDFMKLFKTVPHIHGYLFIQVCLERFCGRLFNNKSKIVLFLFSAFTETQIPSEIFKLACNILKNKLYIKSNFTAPLRKKIRKLRIKL